MLRGMSLSEAQRLAAVYVAPPGHSEHPAGLAADISSMDWQGEISRQFDNTLQFRWLEKNACKYGYILRYPKGKEAVTGLSYQPWHFRYVGRKHACFINKMGITLEEYMHKHRAYGL
jgi:D-alanyl-D-alanine carboxypeptidase